MHGTSTGPRTPEGLARSKRAAWKHGRYSAEALATRRQARASDTRFAVTHGMNIGAALFVVGLLLAIVVAFGVR
jgi:hypothetical protein